MASLPPILAVDDEPDDLYILRRLMAKAGVRNKVVAMEDSLAAIEYLDLEARNGRTLYIPCAVLTDLNMPEKNGLELTRWIRAHPKLKDTRVIMITDSENPADEQRAAELESPILSASFRRHTPSRSFSPTYRASPKPMPNETLASEPQG